MIPKYCHPVIKPTSMKCLLIVVGTSLGLCSTQAFHISPPLKSLHTIKHSHQLYQSSSNIENTLDYSIDILSGDDVSIAQAANFMMDAFWIQPQQIYEYQDTMNVNDATRQQIQELQRMDFQDKYGQVFGKRVLDSCMMGAFGYRNDGGDDLEMLGLVCLDVGLIDISQNYIYKPKEAEALLTNAVSSLSAPQRRKFLKASVSQIADKLLPETIQPMILLSNLAVSPHARKRGIGTQLCLNAEQYILDHWDPIGNLCLKVEAENGNARRIYEGDVLGYQCLSSDETCSALRVDLKEGVFREIEKETLILMKSLI